MRMRYKPYARPELNAWPAYAQRPQDFAGKWQTFFKNPAFPLRLELGCGKGGFLASLALREQNFNYLGVDLKSEVLVVAKRNIEKQFAQAGLPVGNVAITSQNIEHIDAILCPPDVVERIYINFCNPWHKGGYAKHRLTHPRQLTLYRSLLPPGGEIYFKTDDALLFEDSLRYFDFAGFSVVWQTWNLHQKEPAWNIRTEHEEMFSKEGIPIKACIATLQPADLRWEQIVQLKNL
ncbi:MAG: tRNA (guanosine(46)-N7)-methyltransferase TrmB [Oscillospiraceae bacterium]